MKALWLENQTLSYREDLPLPEPSTDETLIRVIKAGICSTDLEMMKGYYPFMGIPGHEFVGVVEQAPGDPSWVGKRVVGEINISCGECRACRRGHRTHCEVRKSVGIKNHDGVFAEYIKLPWGNLHVVPDSVSDDAAVFAEPLAAALEIQEQVHIHPTDQVLVIGAGRLGQLIAQVLALSGCDLQVVARYEHQRAMLDASKVTAINENQVLPGSFDIVIEATGSPGGFSLACNGVRPRGTIVLKSTYAGAVDVNLSAFVVDEITLVGSRCGQFDPALELLKKKWVDPTPLIGARYPLVDGHQAFKMAASPGIFKVLFEMDGG